MSKNNKIHALKFTATLIFIFFFIFVIVYANKFNQSKDSVLYVNPVFLQEFSEEFGYMQLENVSIEISDDQIGIIKYVVQRGDSLGLIAKKFGVTISHLKKINKINAGSTIRPDQVIIITTQEEGMMYQMDKIMNIKVFANKYQLSLEDLMVLNYIQDESEIIYEGQEIFVNISIEKSYDVGLIPRPKPVYKPKNTVTYQPVIRKSNVSTKPTSSSSSSSSTSSYKVSSKIISKRTYNKQISNRFYRGHCTWYAAIITPEIFPYTNKTTQERPFGGNANQWLANAHNAGFRTGKTPVGGAIVVYQMGGKNYASAGHVAKVISYTSGESTMIVEDMNYAGKFIVTRRIENISNSNIKGYIYP